MQQSPHPPETLAALWATVEATWPDAAVFVVDEHQTVRAFSAGASQLLGYDAEEVVGSHCRKSNRCQACVVGCGLQDRRQIDDAPLVLYRKDGTPVAVRKTARAIVDAEGVYRGGVEILVKDTAATTATADTGGAHLPILNDAVDHTIERAGILTRDPAMRRLLEMVENVARADVTVLLRGESGTGKELFARLIHETSHRASGPFIAVNCAAIAPSLLESELFGHEKGAFTGAVAAHHGFFERADSGTIFLDEIAELPLELQAKLLRVLETRTFFRVGGSKPIQVDVRVVSATHRSLRNEVKAGRFREDLLYRLRVVPIFLPPLRDRRTDIPLLVEHFVGRLNAQAAERRGRRIDRIDPDATRALLSWGFPGNVRELKNIIEYAFAVGTGPVLRHGDLPPEMLVSATATSPAAPTSSSATPTPAAARGRGRPATVLDPAERERIQHALSDSDGDIGAAAERLGISRATLWRRRKALGL